MVYIKQLWEVERKEEIKTKEIRINLNDYYHSLIEKESIKKGLTKKEIVKIALIEYFKERKEK